MGAWPASHTFSQPANNMTVPQIGERYVKITDDPFDDSVCEVVAVKKGWVQYALCVPIDRKPGSGYLTDSFESFLTRWKLQPIAI